MRYKDLLIAYLRPQWAKVLLLAALLLGSIGLELLNPQLLRLYIDAAHARGPDAPGAMSVAALLFLGVVLLTAAVSGGRPTRAKMWAGPRPTPSAPT